MALDRAVQLAHHAGDSPPTLRLYEWTRPTVTLGRFQDAGQIDGEFCSAHGIDVVRRQTGGRGVLHDDEVTYSIVAGVADGIPRGTSGSYATLCGGLAEAYARLGVDAALTARSRGSRDSAACYLHATRADLSLGLQETLRIRAGLAGRDRTTARVVHDQPRHRPGGGCVSPDRRGIQTACRRDGHPRGRPSQRPAAWSRTGCHRGGFRCESRRSV